MTFEQRLEWFSERNKIMLFLWNDRFLNPLIPTQLQKIKSSGLLDYDKLLQLLDEHFPQFEDELPPGMYFPVPISRTLSLESLLVYFITFSINNSVSGLGIKTELST